MKSKEKLPGFQALCSQLADLNPDEIFEAGKAEGRRLERIALKRDLLRDAGWKFTHDPPFHDWFKNWIKYRTKPSKRKEEK
jgi:hypothetical protein